MMTFTRACCATARVMLSATDFWKPGACTVTL